MTHKSEAIGLGSSTKEQCLAESDVCPRARARTRAHIHTMHTRARALFQTRALLNTKLSATSTQAAAEGKGGSSRARTHTHTYLRPRRGEGDLDDRRLEGRLVWRLDGGPPCRVSSDKIAGGMQSSGLAGRKPPEGARERHGGGWTTAAFPLLSGEWSKSCVSHSRGNSLSERRERENGRCSLDDEFSLLTIGLS